MSIPTIHHVHFFVRVAEHRRRFWVAPVEIPGNDNHGGSLVVPVDEKNRVFGSYLVDLGNPLKDGNIEIIQRPVSLQSNDCLRLVIDELVIDFQRSTNSGRWELMPYKGKLSHPDFGFRFGEIETVNEESLDQLYDQYNLFVVGCYPFKNYFGIKGTKVADAPSEV